jgi:hypothetical protein
MLHNKLPSCQCRIGIFHFPGLGQQDWQGCLNTCPACYHTGRAENNVSIKLNGGPKFIGTDELSGNLPQLLFFTFFLTFSLSFILSLFRSPFFRPPFFRSPIYNTP